jgi:hypothetical protein
MVKFVPEKGIAVSVDGLLFECFLLAPCHGTNPDSYLNLAQLSRHSFSITYIECN